jgi:hypothetical protein
MLRSARTTIGIPHTVCSIQAEALDHQLGKLPRTSLHTVSLGSCELSKLSPELSLREMDIQRLLLDMPFKKFAQRGFLSHDRDLARLRFAPALWGRLTAADREHVRKAARTAIERYFDSGRG